MNTPTQTQGEARLPFYLKDELDCLLTVDGVGKTQKRLCLAAIQARAISETATLHAQLGEANASRHYLSFLLADAQNSCQELHAQIARLKQREGELSKWLGWSLQFAERFAKDHNDAPTMISCINQARAALQSVAKEGEQS